MAQDTVRAAPSFKGTAITVDSEHSTARKNAKHSGQWIKARETYVQPCFAATPVDQIGTAEVIS